MLLLSPVYYFHFLTPTHPHSLTRTHTPPPCCSSVPLPLYLISIVRTHTHRLQLHPHTLKQQQGTQSNKTHGRPTAAMRRAKSLDRRSYDDITLSVSSASHHFSFRFFSSRFATCFYVCLFLFTFSSPHLSRVLCVCGLPVSPVTNLVRRAHCSLGVVFVVN